MSLFMIDNMLYEIFCRYFKEFSVQKGIRNNFETNYRKYEFNKDFYLYHVSNYIYKIFTNNKYSYLDNNKINFWLYSCITNNFYKYYKNLMPVYLYGNISIFKVSKFCIEFYSHTIIKNNEKTHYSKSDIEYIFLSEKSFVNNLKDNFSIIKEKNKISENQESSLTKIKRTKSLKNRLLTPLKNLINKNHSKETHIPKITLLNDNLIQNKNKSEIESSITSHETSFDKSSIDLNSIQSCPPIYKSNHSFLPTSRKCNRSDRAVSCDLSVENSIIKPILKNCNIKNYTSPDLDEMFRKNKVTFKEKANYLNNNNTYELNIKRSISLKNPPKSKIIIERHNPIYQKFPITALNYQIVNKQQNIKPGKQFIDPKLKLKKLELSKKSFEKPMGNFHNRYSSIIERPMITPNEFYLRRNKSFNAMEEYQEPLIPKQNEYIAYRTRNSDLLSMYQQLNGNREVYQRKYFNNRIRPNTYCSDREFLDNKLNIEIRKTHINLRTPTKPPRNNRGRVMPVDTFSKVI